MNDLAQAYFLSDLSSRELERVKGLAEEREYQPGEPVVRVNDEVHSLYIVRRGRVRVVVPIERSTGLGRSEDVLVALGPGECFGEFSWTDRRPASATVTADEPTSVYELPHERLDQLLAEDPVIARKILHAMLRTVVNRLRSTDAELLLARYLQHCV